MERTIEDIGRAFGEYFPALIKHAQRNEDIRTAISHALDALDDGSLSWAKLNQIMHFCSQAGMSEGYYQYYFLEAPSSHPYNVEIIIPNESFSPPEGCTEIQSLKQLLWGVRRFIFDSMLYWGNFRQAYRELRNSTYLEIEDLFMSKRNIESRMVKRGRVTQPITIPQDQRYLISEMACKTYESKDKVDDVDHVKIAIEAFNELNEEGVDITTIKLKERSRLKAKERNQLGLFDLLFEDTSEPLTSLQDVRALYSDQWDNFKKARTSALMNTRIYLSMCSDLDVYVATSMRTRDDFRSMAKTCDNIFTNEGLRKYNIRYFDPTISAATYHEDKGIIECLMVKTCKVLLYFAQHKESLGKVSELAMALSLGKPVIILCPSDERGTEIYKFYLEKHPLLRLVDFKTGIVNGSMVTQKETDVVILLERIFSNRLEYDLEKKPGTEGYWLLKEKITQSTIRVVTDDQMLSETFWNNYHSAY